MAKKKVEEEETPNVGVRYFIVDLGYAEGEDFCKHLLQASDFSTSLLRSFAADGSKSLKKDELAAHVASRIENLEVTAEDLVLAYCQQPRQWLCVRFGTKAASWPRKRTAIDLLTKMEKGTELVWYGPFGTGAERWYVAAQNVKHHVDIGDDVFKPFPMRWQVAVQVTPTFAALHWFNASTREKQSMQHTSQFAYWHYLNDIFADLRTMLHGDWDAEEPNLAEVILHSAFDRYVDNDSGDYRWIHKAVRSNYESVALNASGSTGGTKEERAASGLTILTQELAETAAQAVGLQKDEKAVTKIERALLRKILRQWGTKSYEFILNAGAGGDGIARMRIYFGAETPLDGKQTQDTIQHVHCFAKYGNSTEALKFILEEWEVDNVDDQDPFNDE